LPAIGILPSLRSGQISPDEAEHLPAQSSRQRRYAPMVFGIIPECRSSSLGISVQLRRNPHQAGWLQKFEMRPDWRANPEIVRPRHGLKKEPNPVLRAS
jgi:hypothetical protein